MSAKELKTDFAPSATAEHGDQDTAPSTGWEGCYPRSFRIIRHALNDLFGNAYTMPHRNNVPNKLDSAEFMTPSELDDMCEVYEQAIDPVHMLADPFQDYGFTFEGLRDWSPMTITLSLKGADGYPITKYEADPYMRTAFEEFMDDMALAANEMEGVRVNPDNGTIKTSDPLLLYRVVRELVYGRNADAQTAMESLDITENDPSFPVEYRSVDLPTDGYESAIATADDPEARKRVISEGRRFLSDQYTQAIALDNMPNRPYLSREDLFMAVQETENRLEFGEPMLRLEEMESVILQETRKQRSYKDNPLLNIH